MASRTQNGQRLVGLQVVHMQAHAVDALHAQGKLVRRYEEPEEYEELRWITGPANPAVLELDGLFDTEANQFRREDPPR